MSNVLNIESPYQSTLDSAIESWNTSNCENDWWCEQPNPTEPNETIDINIYLNRNLEWKFIIYPVIPSIYGSNVRCTDMNTVLYEGSVKL